MSTGAGGGWEAARGPPWPWRSQGAGEQEALGAERSVCRAEPEGVPLAEGPCPANDTVLCLLHSCLGQELSDREIPLTAAEQATFLSEVLRRACHSPGELPPLSQTAPSGPAPFSPSLCSRAGFCLWLLASLSCPLRALPLCWPCPHPPTSTPIVGPAEPPAGGHRILKDGAVSSTQATGDAAPPPLVSTALSPWACFPTELLLAWIHAPAVYHQGC